MNSLAQRPVRTEQRPLVLAAVLLVVVVVSVSAALLVHQLVVASWPPVADADRVVLVELHDVVAGMPWLVFCLKVLGRLETPLVYQALMVVVAVWLLWSRRPVAAVYTVVTILIGLELPRLIKEVVRRPRPGLLDPVADAGGFSFPSGHAMCATIVALTFLVAAWPVLRGRWRRTAVVIVMVGVLLTCLARLGLGVHYLTDVVAGVLLGVGWVALVTAVLVVPLCREGRSPPVSARR